MCTSINKRQEEREATVEREREACVPQSTRDKKRGKQEGSKRQNYAYSPIPIALLLFALNIFLIADNLSHI